MSEEHDNKIEIDNEENDEESKENVPNQEEEKQENPSNANDGKGEETEFDRRMNHFPPNHQYVFKKKSIMTKIKGIFHWAEEYLLEFFNGTVSSFDMIIANSDFNPHIKRLLHAKQLLFLVFVLNTLYLLTSLDNSSFITYCIYISLLGMIIAISMLIIHSYVTESLYLKKDEELEKYVSEKNPEIKNNYCHCCDLIKCMRSFHCMYCNKCVIKFNFHSDWFNLCVGGSNELLYIITFSLVLLFLSICLLILMYDIVLTNKCNGGQLTYHLWFIIYGYIYFSAIRFYREFIQNSLKNLTMYEAKGQRRITYLYKDFSKEYFNPFDKGVAENLKEMWINFYDMFSKDTRPKIVNGNIPLPSDEEADINMNQQNNETKMNQLKMQGELGAFKIFLELNKDSPPFSSSLGHIYKKIEEGEIVNWNVIRIYTIFDIANCPFKHLLVQQAEENIKKYESMMNKSI